ncbi:MAG: hypothetical protein D6696_06500 [Acidobacteria bacterium]|nr:MAG: hypothetical protein D6696_06500 [Acidobacteriota bacterium]
MKSAARESAPSKDFEGFKSHAEPQIRDGFLDWKEERGLMKKALEFGLSGDEAQLCLIALCESSGATIERLAAEEFRRLVRCAVADRFLDRNEHQALEGYGLKLFERRPERGAMVDALIREVLAAQHALSEAELRRDVERRLATLGPPEKPLRPADWRAVREHHLRRARERGVDLEENDVGAILDRCLADSHRTLKRPSPRRRWLLAAAVPLVAALALGAWLFKPAEVVSFPVPPCDVACEQELKDLFNRMTASAAGRRFIAPADDSLLFWSGRLDERCIPYTELTPEERRLAREREPAWRWCEHPDRERLFEQGEAYYVERLENLASGADPCDPVRRCLQLKASSNRCLALAEELGCRKDGS